NSRGREPRAPLSLVSRARGRLSLRQNGFIAMYSLRRIVKITYPGGPRFDIRALFADGPPERDEWWRSWFQPALDGIMRFTPPRTRTYFMRRRWHDVILQILRTLELNSYIPGLSSRQSQREKLRSTGARIRG